MFKNVNFFWNRFLLQQKDFFKNNEILVSFLKNGIFWTVKLYGMMQIIYIVVWAVGSDTNNPA